jgi:hypothetical protein
LYKLNELRSTIPGDAFPKDEKMIRILHSNLVNNYINGYTDKLSLAKEVIDGKTKKIALDKANFLQFAKLNEGGSFNPLTHYLEVKHDQKDIRMQQVRDDRMKKQSSAHIDEQEKIMNRQIKELVSSYGERVKLDKNYLKGISSNRFVNFQAVFLSRKIRDK